MAIWHELQLACCASAALCVSRESMEHIVMAEDPSFQAACCLKNLKTRLAKTLKYCCLRCYPLSGVVLWPERLGIAAPEVLL